MEVEVLLGHVENSAHDTPIHTWTPQSPGLYWACRGEVQCRAWLRHNSHTPIHIGWACHNLEDGMHRRSGETLKLA